MKKITISLIVCILYSFSIFSQVGINTTNPEQEFHIDPLHNNNNTPSSKTDDIVFTSDGSIGIGTINPSKKLHVIGNTRVSGNMITNDTLTISGTGYTQNIGINTETPNANLHISNTSNNSKLRISDGSEESGFILTANTQGNAYWEGIRAMSSISTSRLLPDIIIPGEAKFVSITQDTLSLAPGRWIIIGKSGVSGKINGPAYDLEGYYMYMKLFAEAGFNGDTTGQPVVVGGTGSSSELAVGSSHASVQHLVCIINIPIKKGVPTGSDNYNTKLWISLGSARVSETNNNFGKMLFQAIRVDRPD